MKPIKNLYLYLLLVIAFQANAAPILWQTLTPGLFYARISTPGQFSLSTIHVFRFNLQDYKMQIAFNSDKGTRATTASDLVAANNAIIGVNGGFFSPDFKPLGLRITDGEVLNPIKSTPWWGVFYIAEKHAYIVSQSSYKPDKNIEFAVQSGPRLIVNGNIPTLKPGFANRTALGVTKTGDVVLLATENYPLSTKELANIMQSSREQGGLDCVNALNLDGGGSTQLYAQLKNFIVDVPAINTVTDAVLVIPRK